MNNEDRKLKTQVKMMESLNTIIGKLSAGKNIDFPCSVLSDFCGDVLCEDCPFDSLTNLQATHDAFENLI